MFWGDTNKSKWLEQTRGKTPLGRHEYRWDHKKNRNEIYSDGVDWIVGHRVGTSADSCTHGRELPGTINP